MSLLRMHLIDFLLITVGIAGAMALLIAFNATAINADERAREHATMFVHGVTVARVMRGSVAEGLLTGALGTLAGIAAGHAVLSWIVNENLTETMADIGTLISVAPFSYALAVAAGTVVVAAGRPAADAAQAASYRHLGDAPRGRVDTLDHRRNQGPRAAPDVAKSAPPTFSDEHARFRAAVAIMLLAALAVFAALADELAEWQLFVALDRDVDDVLNERATPVVTTAMEAITWLGSTNGLVLATLAACSVLLVRRRVRGVLLLVLALVGAEVLVALLKVEYARPRPSLAHPLVVQAGGYSFPSGHATASMAVYGTIAYLTLTTVRSRTAKAAITAGALLVVVLIGFSRVYLGEHFPSDVIAGWCVGMVWVAILVLLLWGTLPAFATGRRAWRRSR